jgi:pyruvate formate lyase activating enzyme
MTKSKTNPSPISNWGDCLQKTYDVPDIEKLPIGGFQKQSLIDYPGNITAIVFTQGCNFRCGYCHNPELVLAEELKNTKKLAPKHLLDWIGKNNTLLDAVCITGGEPTLHRSLPKFIHSIKDLGLKVKLDTNGSHPEMLKCLISDKLVDYIAMDIKAPLEIKKYKQIAGGTFNENMFSQIKSSVQLLNKGKVEHEFRTTLDSSLSVNDLEKIAESISGNYFLQIVRMEKNLIKQEGINHSALDLEVILMKKRENLVIRLR